MAVTTHETKQLNATATPYQPESILRRDDRENVYRRNDSRERYDNRSRSFPSGRSQSRERSTSPFRRDNQQRDFQHTQGPRPPYQQSRYNQNRSFSRNNDQGRGRTVWRGRSQNQPGRVTFNNQYPRRYENSNQNGRQTKFDQQLQNCKGCGASGHTRGNCFAFKSVCNNCGKIGHIQAVCLSARRRF